MRWRLWLAQSNTESGIYTLLRVMAVISAIWALTAGYGAYAARRALQTALTEVSAHRRQTEQLARDLRQKQATIAQSETLRVETPDSIGAAEWAETLGIAARDTGVEIETLRMTADLRSQSAPNGAVANGANPGAAAPNGNAPNGASPSNGTNGAAARDPDDGWKKSKFDCMTLGTFRELTAFLNQLAEAPYVLEIAGADMTRDHYDPKTGVLRLRLKLTLTLYGLPKH